MKPEILLSNLIKIKSYSGKEDVLKKYLKHWFSVRKIKSFFQDENLIVHFKGRNRSKAFIFNSHMDTVAAEENLWTYGPWNPTIKKKKLIGLGASDMKSGLAATMLLAKNIKEKGIPPIDLWFTYVVREETDGYGTARFAKWFKKEGFTKKYKSMAAIFAESTGLNGLEYGHRGNIFIEATTYGDSGHASEPEDITIHAVRQMISFADSLQIAIQKWRKEFQSDIFESPTVGELTSIKAGVGIRKDYENGKECIGVQSPNKFPKSCTATFDIRTIPGFHRVALERIVNLGRKLDVKISTAYDPTPSGYTDPADKLIRVAQEVMGSLKLSVSQGSADLGFLTACGIKSIIVGPGEKDQQHKPDEYCYYGKISDAVGVYQAIVDAWLSD